MRAQNMLREALHYRRELFNVGLAAAGYSLHASIAKPTPDDVMVCWNRYGHWHEEAQRFERAGARVLVVENGYLGKDWMGGSWLAMALGHHGGAGTWVDGGPERWDALGAVLAPWRTAGKEVVILGQRGIGEPGIASPEGWAEKTRAKLGTGRIRAHPDTRGAPRAVPLADDLADASCVVTWASSGALHALMMGIPVYHEMPKWIGAQSAWPLDHWPLDRRQLGEKRNDEARLAMFRRLAWAQWRLDEIRSGEAFVHLLGLRQEVAA